MKKTKSYLNKNRRYVDKYKTYFAILAILLLIPTTVTLGKITASTRNYDEDCSTRSMYIFGTESREDDFYISINGGLGFSAVIYNNGTSNSTNVAVTLHVEGGFLKRINETITDTVNIPARGVAIVSTGVIIGLGHITITASANTTEKIEQGIQILLFSKVIDDTWDRLV